MKSSLLTLSAISILGLNLGLPGPWGPLAAHAQDIIPTEVPFDPANFVDPATNVDGYHPTRPGMQWVRAGTTEVGSRKVPHMAISTDRKSVV